MILRASRYLKLIFLSVFTISSCGIAYGLDVDTLPNFDSLEFKNWVKAIDFHKYWYKAAKIDANARKKALSASIKLKIAPDGQLKEFSIKDSSGDSHFDFSCLESITSAAPFKPMPKNRHSYPMAAPGQSQQSNTDKEEYQTIVNFMATKKEPKSVTARFSDIKIKQNTTSPSYLMHLIPLGINEHYPNLFTDAELLAKSNIIGIKATNKPDRVLKAFLDQWQSFILKNKTVTKEVVVKEAAAIKARNHSLLI